jgi:hypothetical protein
MLRWLAFLATVGGALTLSPSADACSIGGPSPHAVEANPDDTAPPREPVVINVEVNVTDSAFCEAHSCDGLHSLVITLVTNDDVTTSEAMGFEIELVAGALPDGLELPPFPVQLYSGGKLALSWYDDDSYDFDLRLTPVDQAGNVGSSITVNVSNGSGCSVGGTPGSWLPIALAVLFACRRRFSDSSPGE